MSEVKVQVTYAVWAPDNASGDAAAKRMALRNEHGAYFDGWRTKGAICESPFPRLWAKAVRVDAAALQCTAAR